jgi:hypothetical protein
MEYQTKYYNYVESTLVDFDLLFTIEHYSRQIFWLSV